MPLDATCKTKHYCHFTKSKLQQRIFLSELGEKINEEIVLVDEKIQYNRTKSLTIDVKQKFQNIPEKNTMASETNYFTRKKTTSVVSLSYIL